jgi:PAS domain S-box-containing protein
VVAVLNQKKNQATKSHLHYGRNLISNYQVEKADREELEVAYQTLNAIFAHTPDSLIALDDALVIQQANRAFCLLVETAPEAVVGRLLAEALPCPELISALQQAAMQLDHLGDGEPFRVELNARYPVKRSLLANIARLRAGRVQGWIVVLHDQSERKRLEHQKNAFINIAAHELRTPLTAVRGFMELLANSAQDQLTPDQKKLLNNVQRGGALLQKLINELLQFAELYSGDLEQGGVSSFTLDSLLHDIVNELQSQAIERQVEIKRHLPSEKILLTTDLRLLHTALYQLILNGVNFNQPNGQVVISAWPNGENLTIEVANTGRGIPQTELEQIFQPFYQVEEHQTRRIGGLGLGLALVRRALSQLGGQIDIASKLDQGATFTLTIPRQKQPEDGELRHLQLELEASQRQSFQYAQHIRDLKEQMQRHFLATLQMITDLMEARDKYTHGHSQRVTATAVAIAQQLNFSPHALRQLETAGWLHNIGKLTAPDTLLNKEGALTASEYEQIKEYFLLGRRILEPLEFLDGLIPIAFGYYERWDGQGYPDGLAGEEIPLGGRILAVANAYHAMISPRSYREARSSREALDIIAADAGRQWDPEVTRLFLEMMNA